MTEQKFFEETEELEEAPDNPGDRGQITALLESLRREVSTLAAKVTRANEAREDSPATENSEAPAVDELLESESLKELLRKSNKETLEQVIAQAPRLDDGMRKALLLTLDRMGEESGTGEDQAIKAASEGDRCLELRERIRTLKSEIEKLSEGYSIFTRGRKKKEGEDRKLAVLLEAELEKAEKELSEILSTVEDPESPDSSPEDEDRWAQ